MNWESTVLELLSASLVRPFFLVLVAVVVLRIFRVEHPASKHAVWTAVLIGMVILPFLSVMVPHLEVQALPEGTYARLNHSRIDTSQPDPAVIPKRHNFSEDGSTADSVLALSLIHI